MSRRAGIPTPTERRARVADPASTRPQRRSTKPTKQQRARDLQQLRDLAPTHTVRELCEILHRARTPIREDLKRLRITPKGGRGATLTRTERHALAVLAHAADICMPLDLANTPVNGRALASLKARGLARRVPGGRDPLWRITLAGLLEYRKSAT